MTERRPVHEVVVIEKAVDKLGRCLIVCLSLLSLLCLVALSKHRVRRAPGDKAFSSDSASQGVGILRVNGPHHWVHSTAPMRQELIRKLTLMVRFFL